MEYPRLLVISHDCLTRHKSNGRTMGSFLLGWPKDKIAQFYIINETPDFVFCQNFFRTTDRQALDCFLGKRNYGNVVSQQELVQNINEGKSATNFTPKKPRKTTINCLLRDVVWSSRRWVNKDFWRWLDEFRPEAILFQIGSSGFTSKLTVDIANRFNIPIVIFNTESYYFNKNSFYLSDSLFDKLFYPVFRRRMRSAFQKVMRRSSFAFYLNDLLRAAYEDEFEIPCRALYTGTEVQRVEELSVHTPPVVSYLGNLGNGRDHALVDLATEMCKVNPNVRLNVYGAVQNEDVRNRLENCEAIRYRGVVPYDEVSRAMRNSDVLVHTENFDPQFLRSTLFGFSTKIADTLASGVCFLVYAPKEIACVQYLRQNQAAFVATNKEELERVLKEILLHPESRQKYRENAFALAERNHRADKNAETFRKIVIEVVESFKR